MVLILPGLVTDPFRSCLVLVQSTVARGTPLWRAPNRHPQVDVSHKLTPSHSRLTVALV